MYICAHVRTVEGLVPALTQRHIEAREVRSGLTTIALPVITADVYALIPQSHGGSLHLYADEWGGKSQQHGEGTVVCAINGEPLRPIYVPRPAGRNWKPGFWQGRFQQRDEIVEVTAATSGTNRTEIRIVHYTIAIDRDSATLVGNTVWHGRHDHLPTGQANFTNAVAAAHIKAWCQHCRHLHFCR